MSKSKLARRDFIRTTLALGAALPLGAIPIILKADNHRLSEDDPTAVAMGFKCPGTTLEIDFGPNHL